jgi:2-polyprenyl-6-methoxyphenol hydroxylase-like FAD-dependent oxidoreductase
MSSESTRRVAGGALPEDTRCVIVGGGPGGLFLALLLARRGVDVTLLESHDDFDRDFRGDTVHPSTLELLAELGLSERVLALDHAALRRMTVVSRAGSTTVADFGRLAVPFPFIAMIPQARLLELLAEEAARHPGFRLGMGCRVTDLLHAPDGVTVSGVRYRQGGSERTLEADLVVAADGRSSTVRRLAELPLVDHGAPMDVLWFAVPRDPGLAVDAVTGLRVGTGRLVVVLVRPDEWLVGYVVLKGTQGEVRSAGLEAFRASVATLVPEIEPGLATLTDWRQVRFLKVASSHLGRWHGAGLLAIGDAAHVMSPVGGVGINYAIQDAVAAANLLAEPLRTGTLTEADLAAVQRRREHPVRFMQRFQGLLQRRLVARALDESPFRLPLFLRVVSVVPVLRDLPARLIGWGLRPETLEEQPRSTE